MAFSRLVMLSVALSPSFIHRLAASPTPTSVVARSWPTASSPSNSKSNAPITPSSVTTPLHPADTSVPPGNTNSTINTVVNSEASLCDVHSPSPPANHTIYIYIDRHALRCKREAPKNEWWNKRPTWIDGFLVWFSVVSGLMLGCMRCGGWIEGWFTPTQRFPGLGRTEMLREERRRQVESCNMCRYSGKRLRNLPTFGVMQTAFRFEFSKAVPMFGGETCPTGCHETHFFTQEQERILVTVGYLSCISYRLPLGTECSARTFSVCIAYSTCMLIPREPKILTTIAFLSDPLVAAEVGQERLPAAEVTVA
ncbi:hypothetical protein M011DRAFT_529690 [Sporormia fimetaria CBS 119925]|uniref:Uncharacterized protein n=1 Tax=Sporormia fimetaria CBS 119925 TaxID=1340428 RepID=A0A6A6UZ19_9PLEO|nr:hypothetical protein M011DRAFT_529690 [Sporormia fimetaria CBS 119925]